MTLDVDFDHPRKDIFDFRRGPYRIQVTDESPTARVTISQAETGQVVKQFSWPAYKVWNIPAHADDIVADLEFGLRAAGSDLLGGNVYDG